MPQIKRLFTLMLVRPWYEESTLGDSYASLVQEEYQGCAELYKSIMHVYKFVFLALLFP